MPLCVCVCNANGVCEYDYITEFAPECTVMESSQTESLGGDCDIDVDECASSPCADGAACTESAVESEVSFDAHRCTCVDRFGDGVCEHDYVGGRRIVTESTVMERIEFSIEFRLFR